VFVVVRVPAGTFFWRGFEVPIFDPVTGKLVDPDGLSSVRFGGGVSVPRARVVDGAKVVPVVRDDDGTPAGFQTEHGDGRVDAHVFAKAAEASTSNGS
jgi:hypothetical protein